MERNKKIKEVKKLPIVCNFQHSQDWPSFQKSVWHVATDLSTVLKKQRSLFFKVFKACFTYLAVGASFFIFFLRNTIFYNCLFNQEILLNAFQVIIFSFWLPLGKVASFLQYSYECNSRNIQPNEQLGWFLWTEFRNKVRDRGGFTRN